MPATQPSLEFTAPIISIISLFISVLTLYLSHLRGPDLIIPLQNNKEIETIKNSTFQSRYDPVRIEFISRIMVINKGIRPGILYNLQVEAPEWINDLNIKPDPKEYLPICIQPGDGYEIFIHHFGYMKDTDLILLDSKPKEGISKLKYTVGGFLPRIKEKRVKIKLSLTKQTYSQLQEGINIKNFLMVKRMN